MDFEEERRNRERDTQTEQRGLGRHHARSQQQPPVGMAGPGVCVGMRVGVCVGMVEGMDVLCSCLCGASLEANDYSICLLGTTDPTFYARALPHKPVHTHSHARTHAHAHATANAHAHAPAHATVHAPAYTHSPTHPLVPNTQGFLTPFTLPH